ncbi:hypothetical protein SAMN02746041_00656 [Desulfacinum hydrothermale DSM 13146]|uniref:DUF2802 domain-containing protein n=1 Tax=Desulfacinum hydrothermale DSM 13146 TaxID=1121390 RepID=A0A1W1X6D0_9BACT|nr:hypothetical protein [Desulfacinum hydrothermale]SMC19373.1 hypothetical protein SAMN02746041_00656 [Desulfacinum hydrothermale DSM 13146]
MESFWTQMDWHTGLQLLIDLVLVALLAGLFLSRRRGGSEEELRSLLGTFEGIVSETKTLADEFEKNLQQRAELIQHILGLLDEKLEKAKDTLDRLDTKPGRTESRPAPPSQRKDTASILRLARSGLSAEEIALATQRPVGEVELILSLDRLARPRDPQGAKKP